MTGSKEIILAPTHGVVAETGWSPPEGGISRAQWFETARYMVRLHGATSWALGDLWLYGLRRKYGDGEKLAAELGVNHKTIKNLASVCKAYESSRRRDDLSFSHHEAATKIKDRDRRDEALDRAAREGLDRNQFRTALLMDRRVRGHQEFARPNFDQRFALLYADPPWQFKTRSPLGGEMTSADNHYDTQDIEWICDLKIGDRYVHEIAADDAALFLWTTPPFLMLANRVIEAWGFGYRSNFAWDKQVSGTGYIALGQHEHLLYCARGEPPRPLKMFPSVFSYRRGRHSAKPPEVRKAIEEMFPHIKQGERLEMFARGKIPGWTVWGNEAEPEIVGPEITRASNVAPVDPRLGQSVKAVIDDLNTDPARREFLAAAEFRRGGK
jgi:N6-adenosine-specific RNA methylase IME4